MTVTPDQGVAACAAGNEERDDVLHSMSLSGKTAIVTGSSRGIGKGIALLLAQCGATVVISSRNQDACETVANEINDSVSRRAAVPIAASISSKEALEALVARTRADIGPIDILVCNAATNPFFGPMSAITDQQFLKVLQNNVIANNWLIQMAVPDMRVAGNGAIVVISSIGGFVGSSSIGAYNISKAADFQLVRNLAVELGPDNIRINAVAPGVIRTDFARALYEDPAREAAIRAATPLDRIGEPEDVAGAAVFLASPAARHITGQVVVVDGGMTIASSAAP